MNALTTQEATELLGQHAYIGQSTKLNNSRIRNLISFAERHNEKTQVVTNNNWSHPPTPSKWAHCRLIGGTTYRYQVWAVIPK